MGRHVTRTKCSWPQHTDTIVSTLPLLVFFLFNSFFYLQKVIHSSFSFLLFCLPSSPSIFFIIYSPSSFLFSFSFFFLYSLFSLSSIFWCLPSSVPNYFIVILSSLLVTITCRYTLPFYLHSSFSDYDIFVIVLFQLFS